MFESNVILIVVGGILSFIFGNLLLEYSPARIIRRLFRMESYEDEGSFFSIAWFLFLDVASWLILMFLVIRCIYWINH